MTSQGSSLTRARRLPPVPKAPAHHEPQRRASLPLDGSIPRPKGAPEPGSQPASSACRPTRGHSSQPASAPLSACAQGGATLPHRHPNSRSASRSPSGVVVATRARRGLDRRREERYLVQAEGAGLATVEARHLLALARTHAQRTQQDAYVLAWQMVAEAVLP